MWVWVPWDPQKFSGLGPQRFLERSEEPGAYWLHQAMLAAGGLAAIWVALFMDIPWR